MLIRAEIVKRANTVLRDWGEASDFTKTYVLLNWSTEIQGITKQEIAVILYPEEIYPSGAPRERPLYKVHSIIQRIRHHPVSDGMMIFSMQRPITVHKGGIGTVTQHEWFIVNITTREEWGWVKARFEKMISGFRSSIRKFNLVIDVPMHERRAKIAKSLDELAEEVSGRIETNSNSEPKKKGRRKIK